MSSYRSEETRAIHNRDKYSRKNKNRNKNKLNTMRHITSAIKIQKSTFKRRLLGDDMKWIHLQSLSD